jgi:hypothetical protein
MSNYRECPNCGSLINGGDTNCKFCKKEVPGEENRLDDISQGKIKPIETNYNLASDEKAFVIFNADKMGFKIISQTHKKGVLGRALVGGLLLGPLGALGGATTAGSHTTEKKSFTPEVLDKGKMVLTNKRFVFIGRNITSVPYEQIIEIKFSKMWLGGTKLEMKYPEMIDGESYNLSGEDSKIADVWFNGIKKLNNN